MSIINIPDEGKEAINIIADISDSEYKEIIDVLKSIKKNLYFHESISRSRKEIKSLDQNTTKKIFMAIISLYMVMGRNNLLSSEELIKDIVESVELEDDKKEIILSERLNELLNQKNILISAKASGVIGDNQKTYLAGKISTSVKPVVFDDQEEIDTVVLLHEMKISFEENDEEKEIFLSMDSKDISKLINLLNKAKKESEKIEKLITDTGLNCVGAIEL